VCALIGGDQTTKLHFYERVQAGSWHFNGDKNCIPARLSTRSLKWSAVRARSLSNHQRFLFCLFRSAAVKIHFGSGENKKSKELPPAELNLRRELFVY